MTSTADGVGSMGSLGAEQHLAVHDHVVNDHGAWATAMNNLGIVPMGLSGQQLVSDSICIQGFDPGLGLLAPINPMMPGISLVPPPPPGPPDLPVIKEIIHCKSCTLFPQNPNLPPPSTRERPPGCKTVFVGGLPENASEEIIRELFDQCGEVIAIRKSKKNFCHIRFSEEFMVDKALYLSGYRMRIGSSTDKKDSGRIHVDFAQARDDLYEWECKQRLLAREERHRRKIHEDFLRPPSPPPVMHFSEHEAGQLAEKLKDDHQFSEATAVLFTWIDRGEVNRRSANHFYSMIQSANSHVRRLMSEKAQHEEEMELAKEKFKNALLAILNQFEQITAVFTAACRQKAWDHFSKAQRKNIDIWRKQCEELRNAHSEEIMGIRREEEMEMSDEDLDESPCKKIRTEDNGVCGQSGASLREENDSLRWQLEAYRNEVELLRKEQGKACRPDDPENSLDTHTHLLQQSMHNMQQQLLTLQEQLRSKEVELEQARDQHRYLEGEVLALRDKMLINGDVLEGTNKESPAKVVNGCTTSQYHSRDRRSEAAMRGPVTSEREALLLGIISTFLHVHPFGANIDYLWSYIQRLDTKVSATELESLMGRLPCVFRQELSGVGATLEKRWKFCGFQSLGAV
ncbi:ecto-NOX disulfide-thiol exchanger 1 isoform X1 [Esox lucius]|uniref:RRM domain-containing protein n=1 Tax=Esox lucius TaxID=8010 RepID=A0A3P8XV01_ESOLU|nr:ecto-NOX disulfide-thiol exchanger 1 isoform X1 [Esox lucius]XP_019910485.2 ecto-NOX disulfide-thiol exchanger 1 isoform X1 [Esox lucius]XP_028969309.2 ecto-NOX disulfide-thiol exchanger 1 isoform X1 [Esox lucius]